MAIEKEKATEEKGRKERKMEETTYLMESRDGMLVSVPESRLDAWMEAQEHLEDPLTPEEEALVEKMVRRVYGEK